MSTTAGAAVAAATFVALYAGHQVGDHVIQSHAQASAKGAPTGAGAHPWTGWPACLRHVASYGLVQAAALGLVCLVAPLRWGGVVAALAVSTGTHAVIDRRWPVRLIIRAKGCQDWPEAPYLIDQSLHAGALLVAAVAAAAVTGPVTAAAVAAGAVGLVGAALAVERWGAVTAGGPVAGASA
ncbi:DUF3307 domain-containing protein [Phytohabitans houttuyneae]|uniref:DUF3307 domain-containing protein n=1 Tax=Phytohabitans houttuyneae TaxID=1076126 RepID=UPI0031E6BC70